MCESETTASTLSLCDLACCTRLQNMCTCKFILKKLREIEVDSTQEACQILEAGKRNMRFCSTAKNQRCARGVPKCARVKRRLVRYRCVTWPAVPDYRTCALVSLFKKTAGDRSRLDWRPVRSWKLVRGICASAPQQRIRGVRGLL